MVTDLPPKNPGVTPLAACKDGSLAFPRWPDCHCLYLFNCIGLL